MEAPTLRALSAAGVAPAGGVGAQEAQEDLRGRLAGGLPSLSPGEIRAVLRLVLGLLGGGRPPWWARHFGFLLSDGEEPLAP